MKKVSLYVVFVMAFVCMASVGFAQSSADVRIISGMLNAQKKAMQNREDAIKQEVEKNANLCAEYTVVTRYSVSTNNGKSSSFDRYSFDKIEATPIFGNRLVVELKNWKRIPQEGWSISCFHRKIGKSYNGSDTVFDMMGDIVAEEKIGKYVVLKVKSK